MRIIIPLRIFLNILIIVILSTITMPAISKEQASQPFTKFPNIEVLNQHGEKINFYNDLVAGKIVAINFIFTRCKMVCPVLGFNFGQLRKDLQNQHKQDVHLISISVDPINDSPEKLHSWAEQFEGGIGWTQVTGSKIAIDSLLKSLESFVPDINDHSTLVLLANDNQQQWKRVDGFSSPKTILAALEPWL